MPPKMGGISLDCEAFGNVVLEAMAAEFPVLVIRTGGAQEIITDGIDGLKNLFSGEN